MNRKQKYLVGAYERLSKEDDHRDESSSIASQKMIIESFAHYSQLTIVKHYVDDGFTGSNFERPGFEQLKHDIEDGKINCVIVKDLSRLGRELYETGSYIEEYFLCQHVRFIAINDGYDSNVGDEMLGIRLSVNDLYLRDTSKKIRSTLDAKRKRGDYIATYAKYGYMKDPQNPKHLIPDTETAPIVIQMFEWMAQGIGTSIISHRLTSQRIPIPSIYKQENRSYCQKELNQGCGIWRPQTVRSIVSDMMYLGHMVQGKWKKISYNSKKCIAVPEEEWFIVENTHEALVTQELFDKVQKELHKKKRFRSKHEKKYLFQGLLKCKECGHNMSIFEKKYKTRSSYYAQCNYYQKYSQYHVCFNHRFNYQLFEEDMICFLKEMSQSCLKHCNFSSIIEKAIQIENQDLIHLNKRLKDIQKNIQKNTQMISQLYEDKFNEIISARQYAILIQKYEDDFQHLQTEQKNVQNQINKIKNSHKKQQYKKYNHLLYEFFQMKYLTPEFIYQLIEKVEIDRNRNIEVYFQVNFYSYSHIDS